MSKAAQVDMELKKAFQELHAQMLETRQKIQIANIQIEELKRQKARAELTVAEVLALDPKTNMYQSVGQMFLAAEVNGVQHLLRVRSRCADEKIKALENSKNFLERSLKNSENNLREMIQLKKERDGL